MPSNVCYCNIHSTGIPRLRRILRGLAWLFPDIGYCQGTGVVCTFIVFHMAFQSSRLENRKFIEKVFLSDICRCLFSAIFHTLPAAELLRGLSCSVKVWSGKLIVLDMTPLGYLGRKTSTQTIHSGIFSSISNDEDYNP